MSDAPEQKPRIPFEELRNLKGARARHRHQTDGVRKQEESSKRMDGARWATYAWSPRSYIQEVSHFFPEAQEIPERIKEKKERTGKPIVMLDVAGYTDGKDIGVDKTINAVLQRGEEMSPDSDERVVVEGDLAEQEVQRRLIAALDKAGAPLSYAFFRPGAAFFIERRNPFVMMRLWELFKEVYKRLDDDGEIYFMVGSLQSDNPIPAFVHELDSAHIPYDIYQSEKHPPFVYSTLRIRKSIGEAGTLES